MTQIVDCIDNLEALPEIDAGCIDAIVTDPPYGLAFMGKSWDKTLPDPRTWAECLRVLKPGGHAVIFGAPRLYHRLAVDVEDAGFEVRDVLMWMFGSGFPKSLDVSKAIDGHLGAERSEVSGAAPDGGTYAAGLNTGFQPRELLAPATPEAAAWAGWGTALKPAYEPILLCRKPLDGTVAANVLAHGTGGINVDGCRIPASPEDIKAAAVPQRATHGYTELGNGEGRSGETFDMSAGRWPANVILDEEAGAILDGQTGLTRSSGHTRRNVGTPSVARGKHAAHIGRGHTDEGGASRFFYCPKASRSERETGLTPPEGGGRANTHPTVKPVALMEWLVRLVTPPGGLVLDPFCGSGSTGVACARLGVRFLGLELDAGYAEIARARIAHAKGPLLR